MPKGRQAELALRRAVGAPRWRLFLSTIAMVLVVVAIAAISARLFVTPSLAWLVAALLRDAAPQVTVAWMPVVLLTGFVGDEDTTAGFAAGATDYVHKPFSPAHIRSRVHAWLLRRRKGDTV